MWGGRLDDYSSDLQHSAAVGAAAAAAAITAAAAAATASRYMCDSSNCLLHVLRVHAVLQRDGRWHGRPAPSANVLCHQRRTSRVCANRDGRHWHVQLSLRPSHPDVLPALATTGDVWMWCRSERAMPTAIPPSVPISTALAPISATSATSATIPPYRSMPRRPDLLGVRMGVQ